MIKERLSQNAQVPWLDGVRGLAILLVVFAHAGLDKWVPGGFGVTAFFFLSGYLIAQRLLDEQAVTGHIDWLAFYGRRVKRLYPALLIFLVSAYSVFGWIGGPIDRLDIPVALLGAANYFDLQGHYHSHVPSIRHPCTILWSLAIELQFYGLIPFCVYGVRVLRELWTRSCAKRAIPRFGIEMLVGVCALILGWRLLLLWGDGPWDVGVRGLEAYLYKATDTRLDSVLYGVILAILVQKQQGKALLASPWGMGMGTLLLLLSFAWTGVLGKWGLKPSLQGLGLVFLMGGLWHGGWPIAVRFLQNKTLRWVGHLSYELYLFHWLALMFLDIAGVRGIAHFPLALGLSLALACAAHYTVRRLFRL